METPFGSSAEKTKRPETEFERRHQQWLQYEANVLSLDSAGIGVFLIGRIIQEANEGRLSFQDLSFNQVCKDILGCCLTAVVMHGIGSLGLKPKFGSNNLVKQERSSKS